MLSDFLEKNFPVVSEGEKLIDVLDKVLKANSYHALVARSSSEYGIASLRDIGRAIFVEGETGIEILEYASLSAILLSPIKYFYSRRLIAVDKSQDIRGIVEKMYRENIGALPVVHGSIVEGIVSEKSLVRIMTTLYPDTDICKYSTSPVESINEDEWVIEAAGTMLSKGFRRLLVNYGSEKSYAGIVTLYTILYNLAGILRNPSGYSSDVLKNYLYTSVRDFSVRVPVYKCPLRFGDAARYLLDSRVGAVLLLEDDKLSIYTERDVVRTLYEVINR